MVLIEHGIGGIVRLVGLVMLIAFMLDLKERR